MVHGLQKRYELSKLFPPYLLFRDKTIQLLIRLSCLRSNKTCSNCRHFSSVNVENDVNIA